MKKYIKNNFFLSKDNTYYIGPGIYNEWLSGQHTLPVLFDYEEISVPADQMPQLLEKITAQGFKFKNTKEKTRNMQSFEFPCEAFIIYCKEDRLKHLIHNRTTIHYIYGSECVFVYKAEHGNSYKFIFDFRLLQHKDTDIAALFRFIKDG